MTKQISMKKENFTEVHTSIENVTMEDKMVLRITKKDKIDQPDENTFARVNDFEFHNGIIEMKMFARLLPDAPDHARGFTGIVYRVNENDSEFESFYVRPTNGRSCADMVRRSHGCQYFSYPGYTFSYFREYGITKYEAQADIDLNEWITLKAVIEDERAEFYLNGQAKPVLVVEDMKHGTGQKGAVGIFVDIGTEAFISELKVTSMD